MSQSKLSQKSDEAFRTISETAQILSVPQHVLRFWGSQFPELTPVKGSGGRRYYRPEDILFLKGIHHLLYEEGYTIKGVRKLIRTRKTSYIVACGTGETEARPGTQSPPTDTLPPATRARLERLLQQLREMRAALK